MSDLPGYVWIDNPKSAGGTMDPDGEGYPWRILLHTMEGWLSAGTVAGHQYPPQIWASPRTDERFQCIPLDRSGFALWQGPDGYWINKACCLQCEIEGFAAEAADWSDEWVRWVAVEIVAPLCRWAASQGHPIDLNQVAVIGPIPGSASEYAPQRLSQAAWRDFNGLCSHRNAPTNDHWDAGGLDVFAVARYAQQALGQTPGGDDSMSAQELAAIMARLDAIDTNVGIHATGVRTRVQQLEDHLDVLWDGAAAFARDPRDGSCWLIWGTSWRRYIATGKELERLRAHWSSKGATASLNDWPGDLLDAIPRLDMILPGLTSVRSDLSAYGTQLTAAVKAAADRGAAAPDQIAAAVLAKLPAGTSDPAAIRRAVLEALGSARIVVPAALAGEAAPDDGGT